MNQSKANSNLERGQAKSIGVWIFAAWELFDAKTLLTKQRRRFHHFTFHGPPARVPTCIQMELSRFLKYETTEIQKTRIELLEWFVDV